MRSSTALPATIGSFAGDDYHANAGARPGPPSDEVLYRANFSARRLPASALVRFARALEPRDMAPGLVIKTRTREALALLERAANIPALRWLAQRKLLPRFDFGRMTRQAAGDLWLNANRKQQRALEDGLRELLLRRYVGALRATAAPSLRLNVKPVRHAHASDDVTVKTLIKGAGKPALAIDYRMENQRQGWKVYEVLIDGVSLTTTYRETFLEAVRRRGIGGLAKALDARHEGFSSARDLHRRACA